MKKTLCTVLALLILCTLPFSPACKAASVWETAAAKAADALRAGSGAFEIGTGDWLTLGLVRSGQNLTSAQKKAYTQSVESALKNTNGVLSRKNTDYARVIIGLTAAGCDASDFQGYDLTLPLADYDATVRQGLNGPVWALIALDCGEYGIPASEKTAKQATRELYIEYILGRELTKGGFAISGDNPDPDMTAMCVTALSRYAYRADVSATLTRAVKQLSSLQRDDGGFASYGVANAESNAQVIIALTSMGISVDDPRFVKNDCSPLDALLSYQLADGSFSHTAGGSANGIAAMQAFLALAALVCGENGDRLYAVTASAFPDIAWASCREAATVLLRMGVLSGFDDGTFRPNATMTRAQYAAILVRALKLKASGKAPFADVANGAWYAGAVAAAYENGLIAGRSGTRFDPEGQVSVVEAKIILARAGKLLKVSATAPAWTADSPSITRGEIAILVYNLLRSAGKV
ncbi:MAG: S-layer homology domain-containing protein [Clostridiaceae bacterium]|nr:S-layer homology domain-containing protein [Clostridiaceae bacterium]